jgi:hypothetical protein
MRTERRSASCLPEHSAAIPTLVSQIERSELGEAKNRAAAVVGGMNLKPPIEAFVISVLEAQPSTNDLIAALRVLHPTLGERWARNPTSHRRTLDKLGALAARHPGVPGGSVFAIPSEAILYMFVGSAAGGSAKGKKLIAGQWTRQPLRRSRVYVRTISGVFRTFCRSLDEACARLQPARFFHLNKPIAVNAEIFSIIFRLTGRYVEMDAHIGEHNIFAVPLPGGSSETLTASRDEHRKVRQALRGPGRHRARSPSSAPPGRKHGPTTGARPQTGSAIPDSEA